jgi:lysophospholipase L1-like esterase
MAFQAEVLQQSRRSEQMEKTVVFFGDSLTVGLATSNISQKSENFGIDGDTIDGLLFRIPRYHLEGARTIVVEIGINNWKHDGFRNFENKYRQLLRELPPSVPVIATAIFPVNVDPKDHPEWAHAPAAIRKANEEIAEACKQFANCRFLDLTPLLGGGVSL